MLEVLLYREDSDSEQFTVRTSALIGRHSACDIRIQDPMASRRHAELVITNGSCKLKDLGAANPIRINGIAVNGEQVLEHNDIIGIGGVRLRVDLRSIDSASDHKTDPAAPIQSAPSGLESDSPSSDKSDLPHLFYGGNSIPIAKNMLFGRFRECDVQITDNRASRKHFEISIDDDGQLWLQDLETVNGTRLNGKRIGRDRIALSHGNRISVGASHFIVQLPNRAKEESGDSNQAVAPDRLASMIGKQLGGYRLNAVLGEGSLAVVFQATQLSLRREVAVKVFRPSVLETNDEFGERLLEAARLSGRVEHDNISRIHECGKEGNDLLWYSMELVDGESLERLIDRDGPLPAETALIILERIARGLEAAQQADICHWDIRPASILINETGTVKILDLGLGQVLQEGQQSSQSSLVVGNPAYMSPERCQGQPGDHRADIYAMGCLLHFLLRGLPPYQHRNPVAIMKAQQKEEIPSLQAHGFTSAIDSLLAGMMHKNPEWRFEDYAELLLEIQQCKSTLGTHKEPSSERLNPASDHQTTRQPSSHTTQPNQRRRSSERRSSSIGTLVNVVIAVGLIVLLMLLGPGLLDKLQQASDPQQAISSVGDQPPPPESRPNDSGNTNQVSALAPTQPNQVQSTSFDKRWQTVRTAAEEASSRQQWAQAERLVQGFAEEIASSSDPAARNLEKLISPRLTIIQAEGTTWYQQQIQSLPEDMKGRMNQLSAMRNQVIQRFRGAVESRFQGTINDANSQLFAARRKAVELLEQNNTSDLLALGQQTLRALEDTPIEDLSKQFLALCEEASRLPHSEESWIVQRNGILQTVGDLQSDPDQGLSAAAALMLDGDIANAKTYLMAHPQLNQGALRLRKERLLSVDTLILSFESPVDLAFITVDYGNVQLENGLGPAQGVNEPTGLIATTPLRGQNWETGVHLQIGSHHDESSTTVSINQQGRPICLLRFHADGVTFIGNNSQGQTEQNDPLSGDGEMRIRFVAQTTGLTIFINDEAILSDWDLPEIQEATLRLDCDHQHWSLQQLHLLGGAK